MGVWGLTDGSAGMVAQVRALADAMGKQAQMKTIRVKKPYVWLPNAVHGALLRGRIFPGFLHADSDALQEPWPELVISCGRKAALVAAGMREKTQPHKPLYIHIQDPQMNPEHFDVVVAMAHDKVEGDNVLKTTYALHSIGPDKLAQAKAKFGPLFDRYAAPHVAVLLGGSTNKYAFTESAMRQVIEQLKAALEQCKGSLLITPSRRTGAENIALLKEAFAGNERVFVYDLEGDNPYMGMLACADMLVVSNDSVNMMSEAHATGKPIFLLALPGHENTKPARFGQMMEQEGVARKLGMPMEAWSYINTHDMDKLAERLRTKLANCVW